MEFSHVPVLAQECMDGLDIKPEGIYLDGTLGGGGHSQLIAERLGPGGRLICIDRDQDALDAAGGRLAPLAGRITFVKSNFEDIKAVLERLDIPAVDGILFDFGVSSYQLDNPERGFSYMHDAPLDMRMDRGQTLTAYEVINTYDRDRLREVLAEYGEERYASRIAAAITEARKNKQVETTLELVDIIKSAMPAAAKREKQHPAKRSFQGVRLEVNRELSSIEKAVRDGLDVLAPGGRMAAISFHSLEDVRVKRIFAEYAQGCTCPKSFPVCICGKKPRIKLTSRGVITATAQELEDNPRSRSAKLRVAEKL